MGWWVCVGVGVWVLCFNSTASLIRGSLSLMRVFGGKVNQVFDSICL